MLAGPDGDNALIIGPAGTVHLSNLDFAVWGGWQAGEARRGPALVRPETLKKLHSQVIAIPAHDAPPDTPPSGCYCLGWGIATMPERPDQMPGMWRRYYRCWRVATRERLDLRLLELMPPLAALCPPATVIDKTRIPSSPNPG
jgi:hypothetical protein